MSEEISGNYIALCDAIADATTKNAHHLMQELQEKGGFHVVACQALATPETTADGIAWLKNNHLADDDEWNGWVGRVTVEIRMMAGRKVEGKT